MTDTIQVHNFPTPEIGYFSTGTPEDDQQIENLTSIFTQDPKFAIRALGICIKPTNTTDAVLAVYRDTGSSGIESLKVVTEGWNKGLDTKLYFDEATEEAIDSSKVVKAIKAGPDNNAKPSKTERIRHERLAIVLSRIAMYNKTIDN